MNRYDQLIAKIKLYIETKYGETLVPIEDIKILISESE